MAVPFARKKCLRRRRPDRTFNWDVRSWTPAAQGAVPPPLRTGRTLAASSPMTQPRADASSRRSARNRSLHPVLPLLELFLGDGLLGRRLFGERELGARREVLYVLMQIPRTGQSLAADVNLAAGQPQDRKQSQSKQTNSPASATGVGGRHGPPPWVFQWIFVIRGGRSLESRNLALFTHLAQSPTSVSRPTVVTLDTIGT